MHIIIVIGTCSTDLCCLTQKCLNNFSQHNLKIDLSKLVCYSLTTLMQQIEPLCPVLRHYLCLGIDSFLVQTQSGHTPFYKIDPTEGEARSSIGIGVQ